MRRFHLDRASVAIRDALAPNPPQPRASESDFRVLLVCRGNICRSSMAHGILRAELARRGFLGTIVVDSAGTSDWNVGRRAHWRARACLRRHGLNIGDLRARQFTPIDFDRSDLIVVMDSANLDDVTAQARTPHDVQRVVRFAADDIADPALDGDEAFERVYDELVDGCDGLIEQVLTRLSAR